MVVELFWHPSQVLGGPTWPGAQQVLGWQCRRRESPGHRALEGLWPGNKPLLCIGSPVALATGAVLPESCLARHTDALEGSGHRKRAMHSE